jgi:hypothetical protein
VRNTFQYQPDSVIPAISIVAVLLRLLFLIITSLIPLLVVPVLALLTPAILGLRSSVTVNSTHTVQALISLTMPFCAVTTPLPTMPMPLHTAPLTVVVSPLVPPLLANLTLPSLRLLAEDVAPLWTIRRVETGVCFGVLADVDAGAALVVAGLPVRDVADTHFVAGDLDGFLD